MAPRRNAESAVLDALQAIKRRITQIRGPNRGSVVQGRLDIRPEHAEQGFLLAAPASASEGAQNSHLTVAFLDYFHGVRVEVEMRVKADAENFGILI